MANSLKKWLFIPFLVVLLMSHNTFATDVVPGNAQLTGWNTAPQLSCWRYYTSEYTSWTGWDAACYIAPGATNVSVKAITLRGSNGGQIWANPGDILQIQIAMVADLTQNQPQIYYLPSDSSTLQVISMRVDGNFTAKEGKQLILTYYAKYVGSTTNPSAVSLGYSSPNARDMFAYGSMDYYLTGYSVSAWSSSLDNNDDIVNAIEDMASSQAQQNDKENEAVENIENQDVSDIPAGDNEAATNLIGNITGIFNQIRDVPTGSDCNIPANWGHLNLGNLNLCTGKENMPFIVNFGATVFQLVFVVGTGLILVRQVLNLYDWSRK